MVLCSKKSLSIIVNTTPQEPFHIISIPYISERAKGIRFKSVDVMLELANAIDNLVCICNIKSSR